MYICEVNIIHLSDNCGHFTFSWQFSFPCYSRDLWTCPCAPWRRRPRCWWGPPCCPWSCPWWRCAGLWRRRDTDRSWRDWPGVSRASGPGEYWSCRYGALKHVKIEKGGPELIFFQTNTAIQNGIDALEYAEWEDQDICWWSRTGGKDCVLHKILPN